MVSQHKQAAAIAKTDQLSSMPLSKISIDDSDPPVVYHGSHMPIAASTPRSTVTHVQEIISVIPQGSLYPTLSFLSSVPVAPATSEHSIFNSMTKGLQQYLQEAEHLHTSENNYFNGIIRSTNTSPTSEAIDVTHDSMTIHMGKPAFTADEVRIPNEKVGCMFITECLQKYLEAYPPSSDKQAFLDLYHMLSLLDLYDNPRQHIYCMSPDNEYVTLLKHATHLHIDISIFQTVWAVLSTLPYTKDNKLEYVKFLQEDYKRYYEYRTREYMVKLEVKTIAIQICMYDSVADDLIEFQIIVTMAQSLYRDNKTNSQKLLMV